jgi:polysaccharide deacetylase family protein (PEP-CTERM system associated)
MLNSESHSTTTVHTMARKLDAGEVLWEEKTPILPHATLDSLIRETKAKSAGALWHVLEVLAHGKKPVVIREIENKGAYYTFPRPNTRRLSVRGGTHCCDVEKSTMKFIYTVDVEDWYQVENLRPALPRDRWMDCEARVEDALDRLLDLCDQRGVKGTFFILGWIARRHPQIVQLIASRGHEIACHGFNHDMLTGMTEVDIRQDIADAKALLEDSASVAVIGYRAPNFSITDRALEILAELGFAYDSSLFPFAQHERYGKVDTTSFEQLGPNVCRHRHNGLLEFLLPMRKVGHIPLPWAGGGYFRLLPGGFYRSGVRAILDRGETFVFYMHPWEIDPGQPYVRALKPSARFRHYVGLAGAYQKLDQLLDRFGGTVRLCDLAQQLGSENSQVGRPLSN